METFKEGDKVRFTSLKRLDGSETFNAYVGDIGKFECIGNDGNAIITKGQIKARVAPTSIELVDKSKPSMVEVKTEKVERVVVEEVKTVSVNLTEQQASILYLFLTSHRTYAGATVLKIVDALKEALDK